MEHLDPTQEYYPKRNSIKTIAFIALPILATVIMSVGVFISRARIKGWIRIYGTPIVAPSSRSVFRLMARKEPHATPVTTLHAKAYLETPSQDYLLGEATTHHPRPKVLDLPVVYPPLPQGRYTVRLEIDSDMGTEQWHLPVTLTNDASLLPQHYPGEEESPSSPPPVKKKERNRILLSLHPANGRGLRERSRELLFLKAQRESGEPVRVKAKLTLTEGLLWLPASDNCLPLTVGRERPECMVAFGEKKALPFVLTTDALGLDTLPLYPISSSITFRIDYRYQKEDGSWSQESSQEVVVGSVDDNTFLGPLPRIIPPQKRFTLSFKVSGSGPLYLQVFTDRQWLQSQVVPIERAFGETVFNTKGMAGFYKLQHTLSYLPLVDTVSTFSFWVHPHPNDPQILEEALKRVLKLRHLSRETATYVKWIQARGLHWKAGYDLKRDLQFFAGLLDRYHHAQVNLLNTKFKHQSRLDSIKRSGQIAVFLLMTVSGLGLMVAIFFAVFLFIRRRQRSILRMSQILDEAGVEENLFKELSSTADEVDSRRQAIAFGVIVAAIVGFVVVASIWLMLNIRWEM